MGEKRMPPLVTLRREDPPPPNCGRVRPTERYADELAEIKADPGNWYALLDYGERVQRARTMASDWRRNNSVPGFELTARNGVVYLRYVGDEA